MSELKYFIRRPDVVPAMQWTGSNLEEIRTFLGGPATADLDPSDNLVLILHHIVGDFEVRVGGWVTRQSEVAEPTVYQEVQGQLPRYVIESS